jgi:hypothetical protein
MAACKYRQIAIPITCESNLWLEQNTGFLENYSLHMAKYRKNV